MATTSLDLTITSDITSNEISLNSKFFVSTNGSTGVTESTGVARKTIGTSDTLLIDISATPVSIIGAKAVLYLKNMDSTFTDYVDVKFGNTGGTYMNSLRIYGGQFAVLPLSCLTDGDGAGTDVDVNVIAATSGTLIEYAMFYEA
jgi:hypothetical protein